MAGAIVAKTQKKQVKPTVSSKNKPSGIRELEQALMSLESTCMQVLDSQFTYDREDVDSLMWQRKFKNLVTPISLALREYKGPRHFHNHYKHREDDDEVLTPVLEDPLEMLSHVCQSALSESQSSFAGMQDKEIARNRYILEMALRKFLAKYQKYRT